MCNIWARAYFVGHHNGSRYAILFPCSFVKKSKIFPFNQSLFPLGVCQNVDGRHHFPISINNNNPSPFISPSAESLFILFLFCVFFFCELNRNLHATLRPGQCVCDYVISIIAVMISIRFFIYWANCGGERWWIETCGCTTTNATCIRQ